MHQNFKDFEEKMKFARHHFDAQTRENERLTKIWDSVKPRDVARLKELGRAARTGTEEQGTGEACPAASRRLG